jgi:O-antigen ligase
MDHSAASRIDYWKAGLRMVGDHPLGAGGNGFKRVYGPRYINEVNGDDFAARAVHNGFINEACEWGIQGFILRMLFVTSAMLMLFRTMRAPATSDQSEFGRLLGLTIFAGMVGFLITCLFGDRLDNEWGYWMVGLTVGYANVFGDAFVLSRGMSRTNLLQDSFGTSVATGML